MASGGKKRRRKAQQFRQRGKAAGGDERGSRQVRRLDADGVNVDRGARDSGRLAKEGGLALVGLDQVEGQVCGKREDQARESGTGAQVNGTIAGLVDQGGELE